MATGIPAGIEQMGVGFYHDPIGEAKLIGEQTLHSYGETIHHPFRDPGYSAANFLGLIPGVGGLVGKALEAGRLVEGAGMIARKLTEAADAKGGNGDERLRGVQQAGRGASYAERCRTSRRG
jgi:hypothetical protein